MENWVKYALEYLNISLSVYQQEQFAVYEQLLLEWNEKFNLTAVRDIEVFELNTFSIR
jgi:16S rRNA (guanine527-N7)-methyltransferase